MNSKKSRGPNFSSNEKEILIHLVTKFKNVVENKKTDAVTTTNKNEGWKNLTAEFNSLSNYSVRNTEQLKTCWDNIKRNTRKDKAKIKKEIILTGGGRPNLPPPGSFQGQIEVILGPTLSGLENQFDSDASSQTQFIELDSDMEATVSQPLCEVDAGPSLLTDEIFNATIPESEPSCSQSKKEECFKVPEESNTKIWNGWSPAALKAKVSSPLDTTKKETPTWLHRRRPKSSLHDNFLESKLELLDMMQRNCKSEAEAKLLILEEQLKQEKIKTQLLELELKSKLND